MGDVTSRGTAADPFVITLGPSVLTDKVATPRRPIPFNVPVTGPDGS